MCIRDRYQRRVHGNSNFQMGCWLGCDETPKYTTRIMRRVFKKVVKDDQGVEREEEEELEVEVEDIVDEGVEQLRLKGISEIQKEEPAPLKQAPIQLEKTEEKEGDPEAHEERNEEIALGQEMKPSTEKAKAVISHQPDRYSNK
eukprot:TRINITY_DN2351_c0_g1_i2.p1 TRINITY_DN2351_c0_g1~~TRINITY_DN2351_c0_g1_i2.p1  ORF type:complete len:165 (+),score=44.14 TRINITY_DN2351_c0_g1_i2:64-495(+)